MAASPPHSRTATRTEARLSAGSSSYAIYRAVQEVVGEAVLPMILGGHENLPSFGDFDKYQEACDDAEHVAARSALIAAGFDPDDPEIEDHMLEEIQACHAQAWERQDPDSEYHKYASPYARELRAERKQPVRARLRGPRRLDRRLSGGRPRTRRSSTSTRSTSRGDPDLDEPPRPARLAPGVFGWARA